MGVCYTWSTLYTVKYSKCWTLLFPCLPAANSLSSSQMPIIEERNLPHWIHVPSQEIIISHSKHWRLLKTSSMSACRWLAITAPVSKSRDGNRLKITNCSAWVRSWRQRGPPMASVCIFSTLLWSVMSKLLTLC